MHPSQLHHIFLFNKRDIQQWQWQRTRKTHIILFQQGVGGNTRKTQESVNGGTYQSPVRIWSPEYQQGPAFYQWDTRSSKETEKWKITRTGSHIMQRHVDKGINIHAFGLYSSLRLGQQPKYHQTGNSLIKLKNRKSLGLDHTSCRGMLIKASIYKRLVFTLHSDLDNSQSTIRLATHSLGYSKKETLPSQATGVVSLLLIPTKILLSIILQRIRTQIDWHLRSEQYGFWPNRLCTDLKFSIGLLAEESREWCSKI